MDPAKTAPAASSTGTKRRGNGVTLGNGEKAQAQAQFLAMFSRTANVSASCRAAGLKRSTVYSWLEHDECFLDAFHDAERQADDALRGEIFRRAVTGIQKPVFYQGKKVASVREYSDVLLIFLAKSRMPEFRDKSQVEHTGPEGAPIPLAVIDRLMRDADEASD